MDLDDYEVPTSSAPSRVSKFAPKSSKFKPKPKSQPKPEPKPEPQPEPQPSKPEPLDLLPKKDEDDAVPLADATVKIDVEEPKHESQERGEPMDVDIAEEVVVEEEEEEAEEDEEDVVVREIDVFFCPSIDADAQLYVFQHPLRPSWRPYDLDEQCEEVRVKPGTKEVEVDLPVDINSSNIDKDAATKLSFKKQTLSTSWKPPCANGYAVGLLMGDKLHLHPVDAIVQLRPSLQHLNTGGSKKKSVIPTGANATVKIEGSIEEKSVAKSKKQAESSIEQKSDGDECWVPLKYHSCKSDISSKYLQQMVVQESSPMNFTMSSYDYVATLCPGGNNNVLPKGPSKSSLLLLPPEVRLTELLTKGRPLHRFSAIKHYAPEYSEEELLEFLQKHATLLWGLWTAKSALLYPQGGVETLARDFVLVLFSKKLTVHSSDVSVGGGLGKHIKNFLKIFGSERSDPLKSGAQPTIYWKFSEVPDESFKKHHPNIVEKQEEVLKCLEQQVSDVASNVGKRKIGRNIVADHRENTKLGKSANSDQPVTSVGGVPPGKMTMSNEIQHALPIALKKIFQNHKVCSFQMICQGLREMAVSNSILPKADSKVVLDAISSLDASPDELKSVISEVAYSINGSYVLKSSPDEPFRDVVLNWFRGGGANGRLKKAEILESARRKLNREVTNLEYSKVMNELCVSKGSYWVMKSGDGSKP
ncbi:hypothetical protein TanjilG_08946 [Lupinus angustifolius]|uniref:DNA-directed RNA polymerase III subunit RPC5 n=1 Tax=Lupinus angustifolius TaxID=3871 RepID=A0A4P1QP77_LUPAN|nr:PREDICTED: DNA-directed RNA polymerase III subunit RPC5 [Lupinus angustifolius]OIV91534.1 hypothetical protein TanjilG_08946 [Lupinus angustifolius]